jgi:hypothetical protein
LPGSETDTTLVFQRGMRIPMDAVSTSCMRFSISVQRLDSSLGRAGPEAQTFLASSGCGRLRAPLQGDSLSRPPWGFGDSRLEKPTGSILVRAGKKSSVCALFASPKTLWCHHSPQPGPRCQDGCRGQSGLLIDLEAPSNTNMEPPNLHIPHSIVLTSPPRLQHKIAPINKPL